MSTKIKARGRVQHPAQHERDAARRYLEHDYAAEHLSGEPSREAHRNAHALDEEHPRARDIALTGTARELGKLPSHLRRHQLEARTRAGIRSDQVEQIRRQYRRPPTQPDAPGEGDDPGTRSRTRQAAAGAGQAVSAGAGAVADTSWGELIGDVFLWGMALSIAYLLLSRAAAAGKLFEGATNVARAVVSPVVDPLNPKGTK